MTVATRASARSRLLLLLLVAVVAVAAAPAAAALQEQVSPAGAAAPAGETLRAKVGDVILVGEQVMCQVERHDRLATMTCIRSASRRGTYGTRISARTVRVFRFERELMARIVFSAKHHASFTTCAQCR